MSRQTLVLGAVLMSGGGLLWGALCLWLGLRAPCIVPFGYVGLTVVNLLVLWRTRRFSRARAVQVSLSLLLPFLLQWALGGFFPSGGVMLWAMIALVGSLTLTSPREAVGWLAFYCVLTVFSGLSDDWFAARAPLTVAPATQRFFLVVNVLTISSIVFTLGLALTHRLRGAVASREEDIERLRAAEVKLKELATSLEAQVAARTAELEAALVRAEAGTRAKSEFLAVMSHELRTPLNGILGTADLLQHGRLEDDQRDLVRLVRRGGDLLLAILNDVLDFSKIEAQRMELVPRTFDLRAELHDVVALHRAAASEQGVALTLSIAEPFPSRLCADPDRIMQVVGNLLANAVKFTPQGSIALEVGCRGEGEALRLDFRVRDTGIGMSPESLGRLFQPFTQVDSTTTRRYGGTGLGLAICSRLVGLMGGAIGVDSALGQGTTFHFHVRALPVVEATPAAQPTGEVARSPSSLGLRVLLAEDNLVNQQVARRLLQRLECEVDVANDGREATDMVARGEYDLVLMDVQMPILDGLGAARAIRALSLGRQPRIVAVTANAYSSDEQACREAGMDDFLPKPLRLDRLRAQLQLTASLSGRRDAA